MSETGVAPDTTVSLSAHGVSLLVDVSADSLPTIIHWGREIIGLTAGQSEELVEATRSVPAANEPDVWRPVSVLPQLATGWTGRPGLEGSRDGAGWSTSFRTTSVTLDGAPVAGFVTHGAGRLVVDAVDPEAELRLVIDLELRPGGLVRARAKVTNTGTSPYDVQGLALAFPVPGEAGELLDFAGRWARERAVQRLPFRVGVHARENRKGRTGADSAYVLHAGTPGFDFASGEVYAVHTAWSGNHLHYAERTHTGQRLLGGGELLMAGEIRLAAGEHYAGPWVYASFGTGLDEVARRFHAHQRSRPHPVTAGRPVTLNVWEAVYFDHDVERLLDLAERAAEVGVERFVLDDGWFGARRDDHAGLGDWVVSSDVWPDGLHPLVDRVRALGMEFGLWFEPEMVNPDSDVVRAHPEWVMSARRTWPVLARNQQVLDLAIPAAYEHIKDQILAVLGEYEIGYIKWDHNRDLIEAGNQLDRGRPAVHAQTVAFYRLLDELRAAHPGLEIESCSSGGARVDLEVLEHTDRVWVSDCIDPLERQHMMRWTTQLIPPEYMGSHIASGRSHTTGRVHDLGFRAGTAVFGHLGIEWDLAAASAEELRELADWLAFYKAHRELLLNGDLVRMDTYDPHLFVHGVLAPDRSRAIFATATVGSLEAVPGPRIRLRGLDPDSLYRVRPILVGGRPSGLRAPSWWGAESPDAPGAGETMSYPGAELSGSALETVGIAPPVVHPDQVVLFGAHRVDGYGPLS